jgi:hypothetical protein
MLWAKRLLVMIKDIVEHGGNCFGRTHCRYAAELSPAIRPLSAGFSSIGRRMPGLDPGIHHPSKKCFVRKMDCRVEPGNDDLVNAGNA